MEDATHGHKRLTLEERRKVLEGYEQSDLTQKEFAAQAGIALSTLHAWRRKMPDPRQPRAARFVEAPNLFAGPAADFCYRLRAPGGVELEIGRGFRSQEVAELLRLLRQL
jgi:DNA-binding XRE family transcriptional regulator